MSGLWMRMDWDGHSEETEHLTGVESGAYLHLISYYWRTRKAIPDDDSILRCASRMEAQWWPRLRSRLAPFFDLKSRPGFWVHHRTEAEIAKSDALSATRRAAIAKRYQGSKSQELGLKSQTRADPMRGQKASNINEGGSTNVLQLYDNVKKEEERKKVREEETKFLPQERKKDNNPKFPNDFNDPAAFVAAKAAPTTGKYAFEYGVIRLNAKDLALWTEAFSHLDLKAELVGLQEWASKQANWFCAVSAALAKRNREVKNAVAEAKALNVKHLDSTQPEYWTSGIVGVT